MSPSDFGERLSRVQDAQIDARALEHSVRDRVLAGARPRVDRSDRRGFAVGGAAIAVAAAAAVALFAWPEGDLTARQGDRPLLAGAWIDAGEVAARIDFSDGTVVTLDPGTTARLATLDDDGAHLVLERGAVDLDVKHTGHADWAVQAGPYSVTVTGTAFRTEWLPDRQVFRVAMRHGSVQVDGPQLAAGRRVEGTDVLEIDLLADQARILVAPTPEVVAAAPQAPAAAPAPASAPVTPAAAAAEDWRVAYERRAYGTAVELAQAEGLDGLLADGPVADLERLADAASLSGAMAIEGRAWEAIRARFAGTESAAVAALRIGRAAQDRDGDHAAAARWFRLAHGESAQPNLRVLALGLHVVALDRAGDARGAKQAAIEYLDTYPDGPHAAFAEGLAPRKR